MTDVTKVDGIGESTKKILESKGVYRLEDFMHDPEKINNVIYNTTISSEKLAKIFTYIEIKGATSERIDKMRENNLALKNDKYIGMKLYSTEHFRNPEHPKMEVITLRNGLYEFGIPNEYGNSLIPLEELKKIIKMQPEFKKEVDRKLKENENQKRLEEEESDKQNELNKIDKEKYLLDDFTANMTSLKRGKILIQLNKMFRYDGKIYSYKELIYELIMIKNGEPEINMRKYASKKTNGEYKELDKPKKEYYVMANGSGMDVNKMQYEYAEFLMGRK